MYNLSAGGNVDHLLEELHEKKRWLDLMIAGLEAAIDSPQHRLIEMAARTFQDQPGHAPKVDLIAGGPGDLAELARSVGQGRLRRPVRAGRRHATSKAPAKTRVSAKKSTGE